MRQKEGKNKTDRCERSRKKKGRKTKKTNVRLNR